MCIGSIINTRAYIATIKPIIIAILNGKVIDFIIYKLDTHLVLKINCTQLWYVCTTERQLDTYGQSTCSYVYCLATKHSICSKKWL